MALLGSDTSVTGPFPKGVLLLETLTGTEELGAPYVFQLGLLSKDPSIDPDDVLGKPLAVGIKLGSGESRYFHGVVTGFEKMGTTRLHTRYAARLNPLLSEFNHTSDCRIFNDPSQDAVGIVTAVLAERGLSDVESGSIKDHVYRAREYCVQYRESDLHFMQRLLEEEGIYYFFRHEESKHTMVLADSISGHETAAGYETVLFTPKERRVAGAEEQFWGMKVRKALYPGRHTVLFGYDASKMRPKQLQFGEAASGEPAPGSEFEHYDYPGGLFDPEEASGEATVRTQADHVDKTVIEVEGNTVGLGVGNLVTLRSRLDGGEEVFPFWNAEDFANQYLIVGASYSISIDQYETGTVAGSDEPFKATYLLQGSQTHHRPRRTVKKPRMGGPQTALVVGPAGEEIWTDNLGRVRVQFDWDRLGGRNEKSTCWVRVAQTWAGARWGAMHIPRIGQEVIVRFLDGDPDRPIVAGALYNADNMPPYELPANQTQSGIKSRSTKGGAASNFNEIRFEDKKGAEELHVQAEKDISTQVKHCQTLNVGVNRSIVVGNDEDNLVEGNRELTVKADDKEDGNPPVKVKDSVVIGGNHDKTVTGTVLQIYADNHSRKVDGEQELVEEKNKYEHVKLAYKLTTDKKFQLIQAATSMTFKGTNVTLDSAGEITMMAGGATISVEKTGMTTFASPTGINLVCGGSALAILPGGIAIAAPAVTAAAGAGSTMALGSETVAIKSNKVTIEAEGVCRIRGKSKLKLQEAEKVKGKKGGAKGGKKESIGFTPIAGASREDSQEAEADKPQWCEAKDDAKPAPPSLTITSETVVTSPKDRARLRIAVGEEVKLTVTPGPATWEITNGEGTLKPKSESVSSIVFIAKDRHGPVTITATREGRTASITFTVVEPESWSMVRKPGSKLRHAHGRPDCGWLGVMCLHPDDVNFHKAETREMDSQYVGTGCYAGFNGDYHGSYPLPDRASDWFPMKRHTPHGTTDDIPDTIYTGDPGARVTGANPPFVKGSGYFPITIQWKMGTGKPKGLPVVKQEDAVSPSGKCESRKGGHLESTKYNDPTSTY